MMVIQPEWDFYFCKVEGKLASIMLDLALEPHLPLSQKPYLIQVGVELQHPDLHGMTTSREAEVLFIMEDRLADHLAEELGGIYVARNTSSNKRTFYYYCASMSGYKDVVNEVMEGFSYAYESQGTADPGWTFYQQFLFPTPQEYRSILNRKVIDKLLAQGDDPQIEREVAHKISFSSISKAENFLEYIQGEGYKLGKLEASRANSGYEVVITAVHSVDLDTMDSIVLKLEQKGQQFGGQYLGWNTLLAVDRQN
jgi:uncharacterized protein (TIGR01619 family)